MKTVNNTSFCKRQSCPSAATLLSYHERKLTSDFDARVVHHLEACDFCCAELQLLIECPQAEDECPTSTMPVALRHLAEEILKGSFLTADMFSESCFEKARLTLTDA